MNGNFINSPTPQGGLLLHWIFSVILISASSAFANLTEAISFPGNLQAYAAAFVGSMYPHCNTMNDANVK
jgi:hypothetical protein